MGFPAGVFQTNCYVVVAERTGEDHAGEDRAPCVIIDPGQDAAPRVAQIVEDEHLCPEAVLLTHGHADHTFNLTEVCAAYDIPVYLHPLDRPQLTNPASAVSEQFAAMVRSVAKDFIEPEKVIEVFDGDTIEVAGLRFAVDHVPGHSLGSVAFTVAESSETATAADPEIIFGGDVLFAGGVGRTDLPGADHAVLLDSIAKKFLTHPEDTVVLSGHGPATTIGAERQGNPFLRDLVEEV